MINMFKYTSSVLLFFKERATYKKSEIYQDWFVNDLNSNDLS